MQDIIQTPPPPIDSTSPNGTVHQRSQMFTTPSKVELEQMRYHQQNSVTSMGSTASSTELQQPMPQQATSLQLEQDLSSSCTATSSLLKANLKSNSIESPERGPTHDTSSIVQENPAATTSECLNSSVNPSEHGLSIVQSRPESYHVTHCGEGVCV